MTMRAIVLSAAIAALFCGTSYAAERVKVDPPQTKTLSSPNGRFVYGQVNDYARDQYMLDTQTGRLWRMVEISVPGETEGSESKATVLEPVIYLDANGSRFDSKFNWNVLPK